MAFDAKFWPGAHFVVVSFRALLNPFSWTDSVFRPRLRSGTIADGRRIASTQMGASMKTTLPLTNLLLSAVLGLTLGGCGSSGDDSTDSGGGARNVGGSKPGTGGGGGGVSLGGSPSSSGAPGAGGASAGTSGSVSAGGSGGSSAQGGSGGLRAQGGGGAGGRAGTAGTGGRAGGGAGGSAGSGTAGGASGGSTGTGTCTASKATTQTVTGSGPHKVVIETNTDAGIKCGTIFRPADLGGTEKYPILVWGEGGCSQDGLSNRAAMGEIASWGYFIVADGTPGSTNACAGGQDGKSMLDYVTWSIAENGKTCSAYHDSLDTTKIAADGFSCGGLMAENVSGDARFTAIGITSSGLMAANKALYDKIHTPFKILTGGPSTAGNDIAYDNGLRDYTEISTRTVPIIYFSQTSAGHGGDLGNAKGTFNTVNLAWLNWQLKNDVGATGKGLLIGASCKYCSAAGWVFKSANVP